MNIFICAVQFKGGSLQVVISLIKEFVKFPENNYYVVMSKEVKKQIHGIDFPNNFHFYDLPYPSKIRLANSYLRGSFLSKIEKESNCDCIICTSGPIYWTPKKPMLIGYNLPHLIYPESPYFNRIPLWMKLRWKVRWATHKVRYRKEASTIFVQTEDVNQRLRKILKTDRIITISNTYNNAYDIQKDYPNKLPQRASNEIRLLTISAFYKHKNFEIIPKTIEALKLKGINNVRFVVTLPDNLFNIAFGQNPPKEIINVGFIPTLEGASLYKECDFMFLPTLLECFSASYAEAMVMKKPILTSDLGFAHTVCNDAAIYFNPDDANDVADKIISLMNSPEKQSDLITKGLAQLKQFGSAEDRAREVLKACKQLTENYHG